MLSSFISPSRRNRLLKTGGLTLALMGSLSLSTPAAAEPLKIWFDKPSANWNEALPVGNGRLGAMILGGVPTEHLQLNDNTLYSGEPGDRDLPLNVAENLGQVREWLSEGKYAEVHAWITKHWLGRAQDCYQPLGDLYLAFPGGSPVTNYHRELDLADATVHETYEQDGVVFTRDIFDSYPAQAIVIRLHASQPGALNFTVKLASVHPTAKTEVLPGDAGLNMKGQVPGFALRRDLKSVEKKGETWKYPEIFDADGQLKPGGKTVLYGDKDHGRGTRFDARVQVQKTDGQYVTGEGSVGVQNASDAVLLVTTGSSFNGFDKSPSHDGKDESAEAEGAMAQAVKQPFDQLQKAHLDDYHALFNRVTLVLGDPTAQSELPTPKRIAGYAEGGDEALAALYYQFGRYLMIAGSRPGGQPLNLQGMWNPYVIPPWAGAYTLNINLEMNYWPVEVSNLDECVEPLLRMIGELAVNGRKVAHDMYGLPGWVAHHNTTIWRDAEPVDGDAGPAFWDMAGPWLCQHLWTHYEFTGDTTFLRDQGYPIMKGAAEFMNAWLVDDGQGHLVTPVGTSPENHFLYTDASGRTNTASLIPGPTMDIALIRELFTNCIQASKILGVDEDFRKELEAKLPRLLPYQIGKGDRLQEWPIDFADQEPTHRHVSHLYGLFPGHQITLRGTPELAAAARKTLELRGDNATGWSLAWKINLWAHLDNGDHAHKCLALLLTPERSYPNLFDSCPPFQIDGNFGGASGIEEMLLQSDAEGIELLPALPTAWPDGHFTGLRAVGGYEIDCSWKDGHLVEAEIRNARSSTCHVRYGDKVVAFDVKPGQTLQLDGNLTVSQSGNAIIPGQSTNDK
jgi:alpha-L-fucosidase 2